MLGLFAFFYVCLHFLTYIGPDQIFDFAAMWKDVEKRRYITVGFLGFVLLIPLAITSTAGWIRRLGGKRWQMLHRSIYVVAICGVIHYYWLVKSDVRDPLFYGALVSILLLWRLGDWYLKKERCGARKDRNGPSFRERFLKIAAFARPIDRFSAATRQTRRQQIPRPKNAAPASKTPRRSAARDPKLPKKHHAALLLFLGLRIVRTIISP